MEATITWNDIKKNPPTKRGDYLVACHGIEKGKMKPIVGIYSFFQDGTWTAVLDDYIVEFWSEVPKHPCA